MKGGEKNGEAGWLWDGEVLQRNGIGSITEWVLLVPSIL